MSPLSILISGAGITGPCLAFWLSTLLPTCKITIVERAPELRTGGQAVDLRSASVEIVRRMGLLEEVLRKNTTEEGMEFVYRNGKGGAVFPVIKEQSVQSMTSEYEILRGDLSRIFYDATVDLPNVTYVFNEMVSAIEQESPSFSTPNSTTPTSSASQVKVTFTTTLQPQIFDLVLGADGMTSRTRRLTFGRGPKNDDFLHRLGQYAALFTIPRTDADTPIAQWYNSTLGRVFIVRPDQYGSTRVYLGVTDGNLSRFDEIERLLRHGTKEQQQDWFAKEFEGAGWGSQTERIISGMYASDDFYMQQIAQVRMVSWVKGRVALVGDAGWCPSPLSGVGTGSAIAGAYVLAGEISKSPEDLPAALERYERVLRPYIRTCQRLAPGTPQMACPQTEWGIWFFNCLMGVIAHPWSRALGGFVGEWLPAFGATSGWTPPDYKKDA